ncbi:chaplin [Embleya sp. NPDC127516]|uniref:chaplin n=1 Tax=Embleya sp. NPDC127516 TaxID=3363990 RepID=UPI0038198912
MNTFKKTGVMVAGSAALVMAGAGAASAGSEADGAAVGSPGVLSGNNVQVPVHIPVNICGNSLNLVGFVNPTFGNFCANIDGDDEHGGRHHEAPQHGGGGHHG